jgi:DNA-binding response OmpR family regulator
MARRSVLIVEDDEDIRMNMVMALESEGYVVFEAEHGAQALTVLGSIPAGQLPGCILLDLMMPIMSGPKFLEILAEEHASDWAKIPVVIVSAKGSLNGTDFKIGPMERIKKPMDLDELYRVVKTHCGEV